MKTFWLTFDPDTVFRGMFCEAYAESYSALSSALWNSPYRDIVNINEDKSLVEKRGLMMLPEAFEAGKGPVAIRRQG